MIIECTLEAIFRVGAQVSLSLSATAHCLPKQVSYVITLWCESFNARSSNPRERTKVNIPQMLLEYFQGALGRRKYAIPEH